MSVTASVKTSKSFEPATLFDKVTCGGKYICITSKDFPLAFGTPFEAIRGVSVNKVDDGFEVRVCVMASIEDYKLFAKVVAAIVEITDGIFVPEDENPTHKNAEEFYDKDWIERQRESDFSAVKSMVSYSGETLVFPGIFVPFCLGPRFLADMDVDIYGEYKAEEANKLEKYLCVMQWVLDDKMDTSSNMTVADPNVAGRRKSISLLSIKNGEVEDFDYISYADLFCVADLDSRDCALLQFRELWKILPPKFFRRLDEYQFIRAQKLTVDMVRRILQRAYALQEPDANARHIYPGFGFDENQNTVILMWNPEISSFKLSDHKETISTMLSGICNWSVWECDKANIGDKFYLVRCGSGKTGIVMSGIFDSHPYGGRDWSGKGRRVFYMDRSPNVILDPDLAPMITTAELEQAIPTFDWKGGHSGRLLSQDEAKILEKLWAKFIEDHRKDVDHKTLNMAFRM